MKKRTQMNDIATTVSAMGRRTRPRPGCGAVAFAFIP
jgi:hypothetical protein